MSVLAPDARERRTIALGGAVLGMALLLATVVVPALGRWRDREAMIDALRRERGQLISLGSHAEALQAVARARSAAVESLPVRLIHGRTAALAASSLQSVLQAYASASRVSVTRLDVASAADATTDGPPSIPATLSAVSDVYGLADFLSRVEHGSRLLEVTELSVSANSALRGELLQISLVVRAPFVLTP
ncbi:MAG: GspMb/PilO family protein [Gemmatimonadota bacterium]